MEVRRIGTRLSIDGYIYKRKGGSKKKAYWTCVRNNWQGIFFQCGARAITSIPETWSDGTIIVHSGPMESPHNHTPTLEEIVNAQYAAVNLKPRKKYVLTKATEAKEKRRAEKFMTDGDTYRIFLSKFAEKPTFDRDHVIEALKIVFKTDQGRIHAYAVILENREKFARDFEAFQSSLDIPDLDVTLYTLDEFHPITDMRTDSNSGPEDETLEELKRRASELQEILTSSRRQGVIEMDSRESEEADVGESGNIPPVPAAIPMKEFLASMSASTSVIDSSNNEIGVRKEIELIDLTNDDDTKQECSKPCTDEGKKLQSNGAIAYAISGEDIVSSNPITSNVTSTKSVHTNSPQNLPNLNICKSHSSTYAVPLDTMSSNSIQEMPWRIDFDQLYNTTRPNLNGSIILVSNLQIPLVHNN